MLKRLAVFILVFGMILATCSGFLVALVPQVSAETTSAVLVSLTNQWKYLDTGIDPAGTGARTSWTAESFDDSGWKTSSGTAKFGAVAGKLGYMSDNATLPTILLNQYLSGTTNNVPSYFFRTSFELSDLPSSGTPLVGTVKYDDAFILYINGTKVAAYGEPTGGYSSNTSYGASVGIGAPEPVEFVVDTSVLKVGKNVVAVELHQANATSSDIYFEMTSLVLGGVSQSHLSMNVGADETKRNFIWRCPVEEGYLEYAVRNGDDFPASYKSVKTSVTSIDNTFVHTASIDNLAYNTEYVYRIKNGATVSINYYFKTDKKGAFNFIYVTDPQIGASGNAETDQTNWTKAVDLATEMFPTANLIVSAGDQIDWPESPADQWGKFFSPEKLKSLALSATIGNHEAYAKQEHIYFNSPNTEINGIQYGKTAGGCNNYFTYNDVLFINLNGNSNSAAEHKVFIEHAINQNPNTTWRIVLIHQSLFGGTASYINENIINLRSALLPVLADYDIDAVLSGHDHVYARTYMLSDGFTPDKSAGVPNKVVDPEGVLYITNSTASGCKYYGLTDMANTPHIAVREQNTPTFANVEVTETSFKVTTYRVNDKSVLDTIEIVKDKELTEARSKYKNVAKGKSYSSPEATGVYTANLTDGLAEVSSDYDGRWYGLLYGTNTNGSADVKIDLLKEQELEKFRVHLRNGGTNSSSGIRNPISIQVYVSNDDASYTAVGTIALETPTEEDFSVYWAELKLSKALNARYVKFNITSTSGWVMLNEIEVYGADIGAGNEGTIEIGDNLAKGKPYTTSELYPSSASASYPDEGGITLTDGILPPNDAKYNHAAYTGFNKNVQDYTDNGYFSVTVDLGKFYNLAKFTAYVGSTYNTSGITPPESMWVYVSVDNEKWELVGAVAPEDSTTISAVPATVELSSPVSAKYVQYRFVAEKSWVLVAEVMAFEAVFNNDTQTPVDPPVDPPVEPSDPSDNPSDPDDPDVPVDPPVDPDDPVDPPVDPDAPIKGDINGKDGIDSMDYVLLKRAYFGTYKLKDIAIGDINGNGEIDSMDYVYLRRAYFGTYVIK